jgi:hypothetical protein
MEPETGPERRAQRRVRELQAQFEQMELVPAALEPVKLRQVARPLAAPTFPMPGVPAAARSFAPLQATFPPRGSGPPRAQLFLSS